MKTYERVVLLHMYYANLRIIFESYKNCLDLSNFDWQTLSIFF